jgi:CHAD domain-containing protein
MHLPGNSAPSMPGKATPAVERSDTQSDAAIGTHRKRRIHAPRAKRHGRGRTPAADEISQTLKAVWSRYRRQLRRGQKRLSIEAVHDLRVQTRRLLVCLDLFAPVIGCAEELAAAHKTLEKRLGALGPLRDAHVQLINLDARLADFPEMTPLHVYLRRRANRLTRSVTKTLRKTGTSKLGHWLGVIRRNVGSKLKDHEAVDRLRTAYLQSWQEGGTALAAARADHFRGEGKVHDARISLKHLRYGAEALPASARTFTAAKLKRLKKSVAGLGQIHDLDVHLQRIAKLEEKGRLAPAATASYRAELARCRGRLVTECARLSRETAPSRADPAKSPVDQAAEND